MEGVLSLAIEAVKGSRFERGQGPGLAQPGKEFKGPNCCIWQFAKVHSKRLRSDRHIQQQSKFGLDGEMEKTCSWLRYKNTAIGCPGRLWILHPWGYSTAKWTGPCMTWSFSEFGPISALNKLGKMISKDPFQCKLFCNNISMLFIKSKVLCCMSCQKYTLKEGKYGFMPLLQPSYLNCDLLWGFILFWWIILFEILQWGSVFGSYASVKGLYFSIHVNIH